MRVFHNLPPSFFILALFSVTNITFFIHKLFVKSCTTYMYLHRQTHGTGFNELLFIFILHGLVCNNKQPNMKSLTLYDKLLSLPFSFYSATCYVNTKTIYVPISSLECNEAVACNKMTVQTLNKDNIFLHWSTKALKSCM